MIAVIRNLRLREGTRTEYSSKAYVVCVRLLMTSGGSGPDRPGSRQDLGRTVSLPISGSLTPQFYGYDLDTATGAKRLVQGSYFPSYSYPYPVPGSRPRGAHARNEDLVHSSIKEVNETSDRRVEPTDVKFFFFYIGGPTDAGNFVRGATPANLLVVVPTFQAYESPAVTLQHVTMAVLSRQFEGQNKAGPTFPADDLCAGGEKGKPFVHGLFCSRRSRFDVSAVWGPWPRSLRRAK